MLLTCVLLKIKYFLNNGSKYWWNSLNFARASTNWTAAEATAERLIIIEPEYDTKDEEFLLHFCQHNRFSQLQSAFIFYYILGSIIVSNRNVMKVDRWMCRYTAFFLLCSTDVDTDCVWLILQKSVSNMRANKPNSLFGLNITVQFDQNGFSHTTQKHT